MELDTVSPSLKTSLGRPPLVRSLESSWKQFSKAWGKAASDAGETQVHDLRVAARRLVSALAITDSVFSDIGAARLRRKFKKILKQLGLLRDAHVRLLIAESRRNRELPKAFRRSLEANVRRETKHGIRALESHSKTRLRKRLKEVEEHVTERLETIAGTRFQALVEKEIRTRHNNFVRARSSFARHGEPSLHAMRIALKNLRYGLETASPLLGVSTQNEVRKLRSLQKRLGAVRDSQILGTSLDAWAKKRGSTALRKTKALRDAFRQEYSAAVDALRSDTQLHGIRIPARMTRNGRIRKLKSLESLVATPESSMQPIVQDPENVVRTH
jgi:CHAD domain-containing protein